MANAPVSPKVKSDLQLSNLESFLTSASPSLPAFAASSSPVCVLPIGTDRARRTRSLMHHRHSVAASISPHFSTCVMCGACSTGHPMPAQHVHLRSSMNEWCAYGMEVPLRVPDCDVPEVVQCYVPYLSAMQLRRAPAPPNAATRAAAALVHFCASDSDCASISDLSASSDRALDSDSDDTPIAGPAAPRRRGRVVFEYNETRPPHMREPLTDCIDMLAATRCPELTSLRSCDLDAASWFSIAWYPLYRLQATGRTIRDLNACFLTYHQLGDAATMAPSLSSLSPAADAALQRRKKAVLAEGVGTAAAVLSPCAMVPYKLAGRTWDDTYRSRKLQLQLLRASNELVTCSGLQHGDFAFFWGALRRR